MPSLNPRSLANIVERNIAHRIWQCDDQELVMIMQLLGGTNGAMGKFGFMAPTDTKIEWMKTGSRPTGSTLTGAAAAPVSLGNDAFGHPVFAPVNWQVADATIFARGMVLELIRVDMSAPEFVYVNSVNAGTNQINVIRGWRGTPTYSYLTGQSLCMLTIVAEECDTPFTMRPVGVTTDLNYFQVFQWGFEDTYRRQKLMKYYGDYDPYEEEVRRVLGGSVGGRNYTGTLPKLLEKSIFYGIPSPGGSAGDASFGGINSFPINQFVFPSWDLDSLLGVVSTLYQAGANIGNTTLLVSSALSEQISRWGYGSLQTGLNDRKIGVKIDEIVTNYGNLKVMTHRALRPNEAYLLDASEMGLLEGWPWTEYVVPQTTALCEVTQIHGAFTFALACPCHHARIRVDSACLPVYACDPACAIGVIDVPTVLPEPGVVVA